jgi:Type IX secretion system protein PorV
LSVYCVNLISKDFMQLRKTGFTIILISLLFTAGYSQVSTNQSLNGALNPIETAVPFLTIAPDSRAGSMGDVGAATSPDVNSTYWNLAKLSFIKEDAGVGISYTPWLRNLVNDINLAYLSGYKRIDRQQVIAASLRYFSLGQIIFTNDAGQVITPFNPNEFAVDLGYSRLFSDKLSGGIAFRFIRSSLSNIGVNGSTDVQPGVAFAADISLFHTDKIKIDNKDATFSYGGVISNIGTKISYYTDAATKEFIPINLRLGTSLKMQLDNFNTLGLALDINKLLVPTPPRYYSAGDTLPNGVTVQNGQNIIMAGKDPNVSVPQGMLQSFYDAPGGFKEELEEWNIAGGLEYIYRNQFALRAGYFNEAQNKGDRKYFTVGLGLKLNVFAIDFAYLVPTSGSNNPLANTIRFSLTFLFDKNYKKSSTSNAG